ncbi:MAG: hypothetical protein AB8F26_12320 [Phycisphaerales bacterium]
MASLIPMMLRLVKTDHAKLAQHAAFNTDFAHPYTPGLGNGSFVDNDDADHRPSKRLQP